MNPTDRLAEVLAALEAVGVPCLVMGGHAVRFYGYARTTDDIDLHVTPDLWGEELPARLGRCGLFPSAGPIEGDSWRPAAFRRFRLGTLPDGRDEWLEFWRSNHLLAPFAELAARSEAGAVGTRSARFLGLADLIRSKETERDKDWRDVEVLERFLDARALAEVASGRRQLADAVTGVRSRTGFENLLRDGLLGEATATEALGRASLPMTQAFLIPFAPHADPVGTEPAVEPVLVQRLRQTAPGSPLHLSIVEVVRRRYIQFRKDQDRENKQRTLAGLE